MSGIFLRRRISGHRVTGGGGGGGPLPTTGLIGWWKADAGVTKDGSNLVSQWNDQSGNGNHFTQPSAGVQPLWEASIKNGLPGIKFTSGGLLPAVMTGIYTILAVVTYPTATFNPNSVLFQFQGGQLFGSSGAATWLGNPFGGGGLYRRNGTTRSVGETISPLNASHYILGYPATGSPMNTSGSVMLGNWYIFDNPWKGHIHELACWNAQLSSGDIAVAESYVTDPARYGSF